jgi:hypothetical protein
MSGWCSGSVLLGLSLVVACGGRSLDVPEGEAGASGDESGGNAGTSGSQAAGSAGFVAAGRSGSGTAGASGSNAGGATGSAGAGSGGTGDGGAGAGASAGASAVTCECPEGIRYGIEYEDSGEDRLLAYNAPSQLVACDVLFGTLSGCSRTLSTSACFGPDGLPPCLTLETSSTAVYVDQTGDVWSGNWSVDYGPTRAENHVGGSFLAVVSAPQRGTLYLRGSIDVCAAGGGVLIPC